ncbi:MAG: hypothetical protein AAGA95_21315 [Pseudomonadota bacterium]
MDTACASLERRPAGFARRRDLCGWGQKPGDATIVFSCGAALQIVYGFDPIAGIRDSVLVIDTGMATN